MAAGGAQSTVAPAVASLVRTPSASRPRVVTATAGDAVNRPGELRLPDRQRASLLRRLARHIREAVGRLVARFRQGSGRDTGAAGRRAACPAAGETAQGAQDKLPRNFDAEEFVARLDQEIAMQDAEIRDREGQAQDEPARVLLQRMSAERDARVLTRAEVLAGRNPIPALQAQADKLSASGDRALAAAFTDRAAAFTDTAEYLLGAGNEFFRRPQPERVERLADLGIADIEQVELMILDGKTPRSVDFRGLSRQWRAAADRSGEQQARKARPQGAVEWGRADWERADDVSHVEGYIRQAVAGLNIGLDPRPELLRHAENLEKKQYDDRVKLTEEPRQLRAMAAQYEALLQETLGYRAGADWLERVKSLHEAAQ